MQKYRHDYPVSHYSLHTILHTLCYKIYPPQLYYVTAADYQSVNSLYIVFRPLFLFPQGQGSNLYFGGQQQVSKSSSLYVVHGKVGRFES